MLAATNRPEILDAALLRPGRFDRRVAVQPPDRVGRRKILEVHTRSIPLADTVDLDALAASTPGMVGADLANLANEAALLAARRQHQRVERSDFTDSLEKILLGAPRGIVLSPTDRERTAYHEAGHALVGMLTPGADSGAQGLDHPPRDGARRHPVGTRRRPGLLHARGPARQAQGGGRGTRRGGDRLRDDHHRSGIRHPAAHGDRPADGRPLGHERRDRPRRGPTRRRVSGRCCRGAARPPRPPSSSSTTRCDA